MIHDMIRYTIKYNTMLYEEIYRIKYYICYRKMVIEAVRVVVAAEEVLMVMTIASISF